MMTVKTLAGQLPHACVNEIWKYGDSEGPHSLLLLLPSLRLATTKKQELLKNVQHNYGFFFFSLVNLKANTFYILMHFTAIFRKSLA